MPVLICFGFFFSFKGTSSHQDLLLSPLSSCSILLLLWPIYDFFFDPLPCSPYNLTSQPTSHPDPLILQPPPPLIWLKASEVQFSSLERAKRGHICPVNDTRLFKPDSSINPTRVSFRALEDLEAGKLMYYSENFHGLLAKSTLYFQSSTDRQKVT